MPCISQDEGRAILAAEAACTEAEAAEAAAAAAKAALDKARAAVMAIDTAITACAGSGIGGQLGHARAEAEAAARVRIHCALQTPPAPCAVLP